MIESVPAWVWWGASAVNSVLIGVMLVRRRRWKQGPAAMAERIANDPAVYRIPSRPLRVLTALDVWSRPARPACLETMERMSAERAWREQEKHGGMIGEGTAYWLDEGGLRHEYSVYHVSRSKP